MKQFSHFSLKNHNSFALDVYCDSFVVLDSVKDAVEAVNKGLFLKEFFILGGGSNVLFASDFQGTVIHPAFGGISLVEEDGNSVLIEVAAGESWENFVNYAIGNGYYGVENLIGIPGNVGSAPVQNIGAYGVEVKDVLVEVRAISLLTGEPVVLSNEQCAFGYRDSVFKHELKGKVLITNIIFKLSKRKNFTLSYTPLKNAVADIKKLTINDVANAVLSIRNAKLPKVGEIGSAGSFFKNPVLPAETVNSLLLSNPDLHYYSIGNDMVKLSAAQLIDLAGCKSWRAGAVSVFPTQPLVIVNYGGATGSEIVDFYKKIQSAVFEMFNVKLEPEVNIL